MGYIFGGNTGVKTAADLDRERLLVDALLNRGASSQPKTLGEGLSAIGDALSYRFARNRLEKENKTANDAGAALAAQLPDLYGGTVPETGPDATPSYQAPEPSAAAQPSFGQTILSKLNPAPAKPAMSGVNAEMAYDPSRPALPPSPAVGDPAIDPTQPQAIPQPTVMAQGGGGSGASPAVQQTGKLQALMKIASDPAFEHMPPVAQELVRKQLEQEILNNDPTHQLQLQKLKQDVAKGNVIEVGGRLIDANTFQPVYDPPPDALQQARIEALKMKGMGGGTPPSGYRFKADGSGLEAIPGGPAAPDSSIAKDVASAISDGTQPPNTQGLYRYGPQVRAELAKQGFDLSKAQLEFNATTRALATMNGPQQTRMRQNIGTLSESLPLVRDLATQWKAGKYPILNKATLVAATQGALGPDAQSLANRLQAQIADVTAELGSVYMGGNSPTDHAFDLAAKSLSADWSESTLLDMVKLAETNVRYRQNALNQPVAGIPNNPYDPRQAVPTISPNFPPPMGSDAQGNQGGKPADWTQEEWDALTPEEQAGFGQ